MGAADVLFAGSVPDGYREYLEPVIFRPWTERLVDVVGLSAGQTVLDVAAGTGVVSRTSAERVGAGGRVIALDVSAAMLAHVGVGFPDGPALETIECTATQLPLADGSVDAVFCQQGFPFIQDRVGAAREMRRVLRPGGRIGAAVWLTSSKLQPFIVYGDALRERGIAEPFPGAYDSSPLTMSVEEVEHVLESAGFDDVDVRVERLELEWPSPAFAARAVAGTPYVATIAALDEDAQREIMADLERRMTAAGGAPVRHLTTSVVACGTAP